MNDFYTFIVSSTINSIVADNVNIFDPQSRLNDTLETCRSIKLKVPNSVVVVFDNSNEPITDEQVSMLRAEADYVHVIEPGIDNYMFNIRGLKGDGEVCMMHHAIRYLKRHNLIGKRVFKLTGRYRLAPSFDIAAYENSSVEGKYVFRRNEWDVSIDHWVTRERVVYLETRLWSMCSTLVDEYFEFLPNLYVYMLSVDNNLEKALNALISEDKLVLFSPIHLEGHPSNTGEYKFE